IVGMSSPWALALTADGANAYVTATRSIFAFARNPLTGTLAVLQSFSFTDDSPLWIAASPDGADVYAGATTKQFRRDPGTGELTFAAASTAAGPLIASVAGMVTPDGASVIVLGYAGVSPELGVFDRDASTGALTLTQVIPVAHIYDFMQLNLSPD